MNRGGVGSWRKSCHNGKVGKKLEALLLVLVVVVGVWWVVKVPKSQNLAATKAPEGKAGKIEEIKGPGEVNVPEVPNLIPTVAAEPGKLDPILMGAGDISVCGQPGDDRTADILGVYPTAVFFTAGDNSNDNNGGQMGQYLNCFGQSWGKYKDRIRPAAGNNDYLTRNGEDYYTYFGAAAGPNGLGYYSYDLGNWHIVVLNSQCPEPMGCTKKSNQYGWLRTDLKKNNYKCVAAIWHKPVFSSGEVYGNDATMQPMWNLLYENNAEIVINGHDHIYERFAPMDPTGKLDEQKGVREFVVGTGGAAYNAVGNVQPNSEVRQGNIFGVLKLTLHPSSYEWEFLPEAGNSFTDSGSSNCH
jgi:acid phosphatase type 7